MFDPKKIFPVVRNSVRKGSDQEVMGAITKLAQAHPELNEQQALAALQQYAAKKGSGQQSPRPGGLTEYLKGKTNVPA